MRAIQAAPDAETKIALYAAAITAIAPRLAVVLAIIQQAAQAEPGLAALWDQIAERRAANMRRFVADLATVTSLRLDPGDAADIVWATNAAELYQLLVGHSPTPGAACSSPARTSPPLQPGNHRRPASRPGEPQHPAGMTRQIISYAPAEGLHRPKRGQRVQDPLRCPRVQHRRAPLGGVALIADRPPGLSQGGFQRVAVGDRPAILTGARSRSCLGPLRARRPAAE